jgi:hypothetical protein
LHWTTIFQLVVRIKVGYDSKRPQAEDSINFVEWTILLERWCWSNYNTKSIFMAMSQITTNIIIHHHKLNCLFVMKLLNGVNEWSNSHDFPLESILTRLHSLLPPLIDLFSFWVCCAEISLLSTFFYIFVSRPGLPRLVSGDEMKETAETIIFRVCFAFFPQGMFLHRMVYSVRLSTVATTSIPF